MACVGRRGHGHELLSEITGKDTGMGRFSRASTLAILRPKRTAGLVAVVDPTDAYRVKTCASSRRNRTCCHSVPNAYSALVPGELRGFCSLRGAGHATGWESRGDAAAGQAAVLVCSACHGQEGKPLRPIRTLAASIASLGRCVPSKAAIATRSS